MTRVPVKLIGELTGYTAGELVVVHLEVCNHEVSAGDVSSDASDKTADRAHLKYGSTYCCSPRGRWHVCNEATTPPRLR